jgi:hypothetical protein
MGAELVEDFVDGSAVGAEGGAGEAKPGAKRAVCAGLARVSP